MTNIRYPALYLSADKCSVDAQNSYLNCIISYSVFTIIGAWLGIISIQTKEYALVVALIFLLSIAVSLLMFFKNFNETWYRSRALAESIKTSTWKFMMRAEPYEDTSSIEIAKSKFRKLLLNILNEHNELAKMFGSDFLDEEQITLSMCNVRAESLENRKEIYLKDRIKEQQKWYKNKSEWNRKRGLLFFCLFIFFQFVVIVFVLLRIAYPEWKYWPTEAFIVTSGCILTWLHLKRFRELSAAYGLTAHEIGILLTELDVINNEEEFSTFVNNAENAFSREHTQWLARKS